MIKIFGPTPPSEVWIACSGGPDSIFAYSFLSKRKDRKVRLTFFHHGDEASEEALHQVHDFASQRNVDFYWEKISRIKPPKTSPEEHWRNERYKLLNKLPGLVVTGHHLDDAMETWLFSSVHGQPRLIPYQTNNVIRPFLLTEKSQILAWLKKEGLPFHEDPMNLNLRLPRNRIRHNIMPEVKMVNPGFSKVIRKKYLAMGR